VYLTFNFTVGTALLPEREFKAYLIMASQEPAR
jgi:hypothetical protein